MKCRPPISRRTFLKLTAAVAAGMRVYALFFRVDLKEFILSSERQMPPASIQQPNLIMKLNTQILTCKSADFFCNLKSFFGLINGGLNTRITHFHSERR